MCTWLTVRTDVNVKKVDDWTTYQNNQPVVHEGGDEVAVYAGLALRGKAGWIATIAGAAGFLAVMLSIGLSGGFD